MGRVATIVPAEHKQRANYDGAHWKTSSLDAGPYFRNQDYQLKGASNTNMNNSADYYRATGTRSSDTDSSTTLSSGSTVCPNIDVPLPIIVSVFSNQTETWHNILLPTKQSMMPLACNNTFFVPPATVFSNRLST